MAEAQTTALHHVTASGPPPDATYHCDVVVIGTGPGGMAALASAADTGANIHAIEALDDLGGNAIWSTGYMAFVNSRAQIEAGISDSAAAFIADAEHSIDQLRPRYPMIHDPALLALFAEHSAETYEILLSRGLRFSRFIPRPLQHRTLRMLAVEDMAAFRPAYAADFARKNTRLFKRTIAKQLLVDRGKVIGVRAQTAAGQWLEWRCAAVVIATGGYQANPELRARHVPGYLARAPYLGVDSCRGDGHLMAGAIGADLINMAQVLPLVIVSSSFVEDCIAVNLQGQRFHDEAGPYEMRVEALGRQTERRAFYIFDQQTLDRKSALLAQMPEPACSAENLPDLALRLGVDGPGLQGSVSAWNRFLATTAVQDQAFGRVILPEQRRPIAAGPYHAVPMVVGSNFVSGGMQVTEAMQVVDVFGQAIPGLYAAGDALGGLNPTAELGGMRLCGGFTLGRLAGKAAALGQTAPVRVPKLQGASLPSMLSSRIALVDIKE